MEAWTSMEEAEKDGRIPLSLLALPKRRLGL